MIRRLFAAVALVLVVLVAPVSADVDAIPVAAPLPAEQFAYLNLFTVSSSFFSPGWDSIKAVSLSEDRLVRFFYRKWDGLMVAVLEDNFGQVLAQTRAWFIGENLEQFDVTLSTKGIPWETAIIVFGYNRNSGLATRKLVWWQVQSR